MAKITEWTGAASGDPAVAGNWDNGVPESGDTAVFRENAVDVDTNLGGLSAVELAVLVQEQSYTGLWGTDSAYFQIGAEEVRLGEHYGPGTPAGSKRVKLDLQAPGTGNTTIVTVYNSASSAEDGDVPPIQLLMDDANGELHVRKGKVGLAVDDPTETSTVDLIEVSWTNNRATDAEVIVGEGVTLTEILKTGGKLTLRCAATTVENTYGNIQSEGDGAITTFTMVGGVAVLNSEGTVTTINANGGHTDLTRSGASRAVGTINLKGGGQVSLDPDIVTVTTWAMGETLKLMAQKV